MNKIEVKDDLRYIDVTDEWLSTANPHSHKLEFDDYFISDDGIKHPIKGKEKVHQIPKSGEEYEMALWIKSTFGGEIHLVPRITDLTNTGISTHTPDFRWNGEKWDLKTPSKKGKFKNSLERFLKKKNAKMQANRFIINYKNFPLKTDSEILDVVGKTLNNRNWVEELIVVRNNKIIKVYSKK